MPTCSPASGAYRHSSTVNALSHHCCSADVMHGNLARGWALQPLRSLALRCRCLNGYRYAMKALQLVLRRLAEAFRQAKRHRRARRSPSVKARLRSHVLSGLDRAGGCGAHHPSRRAAKWGRHSFDARPRLCVIGSRVLGVRLGRMVQFALTPATEELRLVRFHSWDAFIGCPRGPWIGLFRIASWIALRADRISIEPKIGFGATSNTTRHGRPLSVGRLASYSSFLSWS